MALAFDRGILGQEYDRTEHEPVTADDLVAFARALGETWPRFVEPGPELVGHPTYCLRFRGKRHFPDALAGALPLRMSFDAGKDIMFGEPIRPGDRITVVSSVHEVYEKTGRTGGMVFVVLRFTLTAQDGRRVATVDNRLMFRGSS